MQFSSNEKFFDVEGIVYSNFRIEKKVCFRKHTKSVNSVLFLPPRSLISVSDDRKVCIYDLELEIVSQEFAIAKDWIRELTKLDSNTFFLGGDDKILRGFNRENENSTEFRHFFDLAMVHFINRILKLDDRLLLLYCYDSPLCIVDVNQRTVIRRLKKESLNCNSKFLLSIKNKSLFYCSTNNINANKIKAIETENGETVKEYEKHKKFISSLYIYLNAEQREILIAGMWDSELLFYDTETKKLLFKTLIISTNSWGIAMFRRSFLIIAGSDGFCEIFHFNDSCRKVNLVLQQKITGGAIYGVVITETTKSKIRFATCSNDQKVLLNDLLFESEGIDIDEEERQEYSKNNLFQNFELKFINFTFSVGKVFLCL